MVIGKAGSTTTNLELYGNATIGIKGDNNTTLTSYAAVTAESSLTVKGETDLKSTTIDGVTIKWDSTLGALTFSKG